MQKEGFLRDNSPKIEGRCLALQSGVDKLILRIFLFRFLFVNKIDIEITIPIIPIG